MIQAYSNNISVASEAAVPFNEVSVKKGCSESMQGASTILFEKCGVYKIDVNASLVATDEGDITLQLQKDNTLLPQAKITETAADTAGTHALAFTTYVTVPKSNSNCPCVIPTTINLINSGVAVTGDVNIVVDKEV